MIDAKNHEKKFTLKDSHIEAITEVTADGTNPATTFGYDNGLLQTVTYPRGNSVQYDYSNGILDTITESPGLDGVEDPEYPVEPNRATSFKYEDFSKNLQSITYPDGWSHHYTYNEYSQVTSEYSTMLYAGEETPVGQTLFYEYHPESNPGGASPTPESPRLHANILPPVCDKM